jgi:hypothetical protein
MRTGVVLSYVIEGAAVKAISGSSAGQFAFVCACHVENCFTSSEDGR